MIPRQDARKHNFPFQEVARTTRLHCYRERDQRNVVPIVRARRVKFYLAPHYITALKVHVRGRDSTGRGDNERDEDESPRLHER